MTGHSGVSPGSAPLRYRLLQVCFKTIVFYELNCDPKSPGALVTPMSSPWLAFQQYLWDQAILFHTDIPDSQSNFEGFSYIGIWSLQIMESCHQLDNISKSHSPLIQLLLNDSLDI